MTNWMTTEKAVEGLAGHARFARAMERRPLMYSRVKLASIFAEAWAAGRDAARRKLDELRAAGPRYSVHDTGLFGEPSDDNVVGYLLDSCGGAWLWVDGRSATHRALKSYFGPSASDLACRSACADLPGGGRVYYSSAYPKGFHLSFFDWHGRQEVSVDEAATAAARDVLARYGLVTSVRTYID